MFDAIVLAGGAARRLGGVDKPGVALAGTSMLDRVLIAVADADRIVAVGPTRPTQRDVTWTREDPAGGGPVAAVAAGLRETSAGTVVVVAADLPWIGPAVPVLLAALGTAGAALLVDASGRVNNLAGAWRRTALERAIAALGDPHGAAMRTLVAAVDTVLVADTGAWGADCDTWDDVERARDRIEQEDRRG